MLATLKKNLSTSDLRFVQVIEVEKREPRNKSSMLLESSCSEVENRKDEIDLTRGNFHFPRSGRPAKV